MNSRRLLFFLVGLALAASLMAVMLRYSRPVSEKSSTPSSPADLLHDPRYAKYDFRRGDPRVVDFGTQPLWVPAAVVTEVLRRDRTLKAALDELGLIVHYHPFLKGNDLNFFLARGDLDAGVAGDLPAINAAATQDVLVTSMIHQGFISLIGRKQWILPELRGQNIGYAYGSSAHFVLLQALDRQGVSPKDVNLVPMDILEMPQALEKNQIAAFTSWEPNTAIIIKNYQKFTAFYRARYAGYFYFSKNVAETRPAVPKLFIAAQLRATGWLHVDRRHLLQACQWALDAHKSFVGTKSPLTVAEYAEITRTDILDVAPVPTIPEADLGPEGALTAKFAFLKTLVPGSFARSWESVRQRFDRIMVPEVLKDAAKYRLTGYDYSDEPL